MSYPTKGNAMILAVGTAIPPNYIYQSEYADYYCRVTGSEHIPELKNKLQKICDGTMIRKRHFHLTEEMVKSNPSIATYNEPSLDARQDILLDAVPKLGEEAARKALEEWGQSKSKITHLVFGTATGCLNMPGPDHQLANLLELSPSINRLMVYLQGCYAGGTVLRVAKDIVENNPGSRVLVVCSESTVATFRGPTGVNVEDLVITSLFGDAAGAVIVGSNPDLSVERPIFEMISTNQAFVPGTKDAIYCRITEAGLSIRLSHSVPKFVYKNIEKCMHDAFSPLGITDWNSLFWIVHPGGKKILCGIEDELALKKEKMQVSKHVLAEYGNTVGSIIFFVMDEMRRRSKEEGKATTGEGLEFGVLFGFGPGLTIETIVLRAAANPTIN